MAFWRRRGPELPEGWADDIGRRVPLWRRYDAEQQARLVALAEDLVATKRWEAAHGFELTDEVLAVVAVQAAMLVLELEHPDPYAEVGAIIVHPSMLVLHGERPADEGAGLFTDEPEHLCGLADHDGGPVAIAWDDARHEARHPRRGDNLVFHEFAHKLDLLDHVADGTPPFADAIRHDRWVEVCTRAYDALCDEVDAADDDADEGLLRDYATFDAAEFFAVTTEVFFTRPADLRAQHPDLYAVFADYYRQDPATTA